MEYWNRVRPCSVFRKRLISHDLTTIWYLTMKGVIVLLALPLLIAGCSVLDSSPASKLGDADFATPMIRTKQQSFSFGENAIDIIIPVTFANETEAPVFIDPCGKDMPGFALEKKGKKWKTAYQSVCMAMYVPPIEVAPESTFVGTQFISLTMGSRAREGGPASWSRQSVPDRLQPERPDARRHRQADQHDHDVPGWLERTGRRA